ncbi:SRPBCC family protein [Leptospira wolffii]|uniref:SRPBCC family protein n=1 Tax=Leptospira wolffii TaxID=409998 RepID=UPI0002DCDC5A|nr:SRPBCC family protein [Leptospira wolffii]EPG65386.1 polyketide cyclase/dehydrase and lipid transport [Leptospira wolffii serovar Khorat str. Khorat-H2]
MSVLKYILLSVLGLLLLTLAIALFLPKNFYSEAEIVVERPKKETFDFIKNIKNQNRYSKWFLLDPNIKMRYSGEDGKVGFISYWKSDIKDVGVGEQEIVKILEGERMEVEIRIQEPFVSKDSAFTRVESLSENRTKIVSGYYGKMLYPTNLMTPFIRNMISEDMKGNLERLKKILEKK